jgi:hypothetical protein
VRRDAAIAAWVGAALVVALVAGALVRFGLPRAEVRIEAASVDPRLRDGWRRLYAVQSAGVASRQDLLLLCAESVETALRGRVFADGPKLAAALDARRPILDELTAAIVDGGASAGHSARTGDDGAGVYSESLQLVRVLLARALVQSADGRGPEAERSLLAAWTLMDDVRGRSPTRRGRFGWLPEVRELGVLREISSRRHEVDADGWLARLAALPDPGGTVRADAIEMGALHGRAAFGDFEALPVRLRAGRPSDHARAADAWMRLVFSQALGDPCAPIPFGGQASDKEPDDAMRFARSVTHQRTATQAVLVARRALARGHPPADVLAEVSAQLPPCWEAGVDARQSYVFVRFSGIESARAFPSQPVFGVVPLR